MNSQMTIVPLYPKVGRLMFFIQRQLNGEKQILCLPSGRAGGFAGIWVFDSSPLLFNTQSAVQAELDHVLTNGGPDHLDHRRVWSNFRYQADGWSDMCGI